MPLRISASGHDDDALIRSIERSINEMFAVIASIALTRINFDAIDFDAADMFQAVVALCRSPLATLHVK